MSIQETKFRHEHIETPRLYTDDIVYMGHELPLYDTTTKTLVTGTKEKTIELGVPQLTEVTGYYSYIRILPHSPAFADYGTLTLTSLRLDFVARSTQTEEYIVLYVYGYKDGQYVYLGTSSDVYYNPRVNATLNFKFNPIKLYESDGNEVMPYGQVFVRPHLVTIDSNGVITGGLDDTAWDSALNTVIKIKGASKTDIKFSPYVVTDGDDYITPHVVIGLVESVYQTDEKIPHNLNGDVHLTPSDRDKIERLTNLGEVVLAEKQNRVSILDTKKNNPNYVRSVLETVVSSVVIPDDTMIGKKLTNFIYIGLTDNGQNNPNIITNKFLQADCFDESDNLLATFLSTDKSSEQSDYTTTWGFENFRIDESYKKIEFRLSNSGASRQTTYINFKASSLQDGNGNRVLYRTGWVTKWAEGQNVSNITTNQFTCDFVMLFEDAVVSGYEFIHHLDDSSVHVTEEEKEKIQGWIDIAKNTVIERTINSGDFFDIITGYGAEVITGFSMEVSKDYYDLVVKSVVVRRNDNIELNGSNLFLYAKCYNANNEVLDVFYSTNSVTQSQTTEKICTWEFEDFAISPRYAKICFHCTTIKNEQQTQKVRTRRFLKDGANLYKNGWNTFWNESLNIQNFTTDFTLNCEQKYSNILQHPNNTEVHVNSLEKELISQIPSLLERIAELEYAVTSLQSS